jgi:hypothetical protein
LTACGKQVGKDAGGVTPPVVTPNPGTANPPANPQVIYSGYLDFVNSNFYTNQGFSIAPDYTNNHITTAQSWITIVDVDVMNTGNADTIQVKLYRYADGAQTTKCILSRIGNHYVDSRTTQSLNVDCQFFVPQGSTMVLVFPDPSGSRQSGSVRADIDIVR